MQSIAETPATDTEGKAPKRCAGCGEVKALIKPHYLRYTQSREYRGAKYCLSCCRRDSRRFSDGSGLDLVGRLV